MFKLFLGLVLFNGAFSKWTPETVKVLTNEVNPEILSVYADWPNKLTDITMDAIRDYLEQNHDTQISIPPLDVNFTEPILGMDLINGEFKANNGIFRNPATITRKGNSSIGHQGLFNANLTTTVGFTDMEVYFPSYQATIIGISETGDVRVTIGTNEIRLEVSINILPKCTVAISDLKITKFADITSDISGLGILDGLANRITSWVLSSYETQLTDLIQKIVSDKLTDVLAKTGGFCKYKQLNAEIPVSLRNLSCQRVSDKKVFQCKAN